MRRRIAASTASLVALVAAAGVAAPACAPERSGLRVFAAASLTDVVSALAARFEDASVEASFGASSVLARQIRDGAPADVFLSASPAWMEFLADARALAGESVVLARNRLVAVAPRGGPLAARGVADARALLGALGPAERVAIADEGVPAGEYARAALRQQGLWDDARGRFVGQKDVRAVLHAVETGALPAGFVYATDAAAGDVAVLFAFDPAILPPIEYRAAVLRGAPRPAAARRFLDFLQGPAARRVLADAGFALP